MVNGKAAAGPSVIKRAGHNEPYSEPKLHASVARACRSVRTLEGEALLIADHVSRAVTRWIATHAEVTARDVRAQALEALIPLHAQAAYAYDIHGSVL